LKLWTKEVQTLMEFGLTRCQAKVLLTLTRLGEDSRAQAISKFSNVARQDVYRILNELHQLGLVERVIAQPNRFRAIPLREAASILLRRKMKACAELNAKVKEFAENNLEKAAFSQKGDRFALITDKEAIKFKTKEVIENSQAEILYVSPYNELTQWLLSLNESYVGSMKRGVKIKCATDAPRDHDNNSLIMKDYIENPQFDLRIVQSMPKAKFGIYDRKEIIMALFMDYEIGGSPALQSDNESFVAIAAEYFETIWKTGIEVNPKSDKSEKFKKLHPLETI
jgi:sugar-specific transcriptional regulator TrmB